MEYYTEVLKNHYFDFEGRVARKPFWMFVLINFVIAMGIGIIGGLLLGDNGTWLANLYSLAVLLPSLGIAVRRLHDIGKSGWWVLIGLIPLIGLIVLIVFYATPTKQQTA